MATTGQVLCKKYRGGQKTKRRGHLNTDPKEVREQTRSLSGDSNAGRSKGQVKSPKAKGVLVLRMFEKQQGGQCDYS